MDCSIVLFDWLLTPTLAMMVSPSTNPVLARLSEHEMGPVTQQKYPRVFSSLAEAGDLKEKI